MYSFITKKQTTKFPSANFQKMLSPSSIMLRIQRLGENNVELDQDLRCLQIQLFSSLVKRERIRINRTNFWVPILI